MEHFYEQLGENWFNYPDLYRDVVAEVPSGARVVEVGSWLGRSAAFMAVEIINSGKEIEFSCVDTWLGSEEHQGHSFLVSGTLYEEFLRNIEPVRHVIHPLRLSSVEAARSFADDSLAFVFIDASHRYEDVLADIAAWLPKVQPGGLIAGHDYEREGVARAVQECFASGVLQHGTGAGACWAHRKPGGPILNVITPVSRPENLPRIYENLLGVEGFDLRWFPVFDPRFSASEKTASFQGRVPVHTAVVGTTRGWGGSQRTSCLERLAEGWCYFLDDDNLVHPRFAHALRRGISERPHAGVIVFHQLHGDGSLRLPCGPELVKYGHIDTGQFVIRREFAAGTPWPDTQSNDWEFIRPLFERAPEAFHYVAEDATFYNALR